MTTRRRLCAGSSRGIRPISRISTRVGIFDGRDSDRFCLRQRIPSDRHTTSECSGRWDPTKVLDIGRFRSSSAYRPLMTRSEPRKPRAFRAGPKFGAAYCLICRRYPDGAIADDDPTAGRRAGLWRPRGGVSRTSSLSDLPLRRSL
jgi:hypothetical protein